MQMQGDSILVDYDHYITINVIFSIFSDAFLCKFVLEVQPLH